MRRWVHFCERKGCTRRSSRNGAPPRKRRLAVHRHAVLRGHRPRRSASWSWNASCGAKRPRCGNRGAAGAEKKSPGDLGGRGRYHGPDARTMIVELIEEAVDHGARQRARVCGGGTECADGGALAWCASAGRTTRPACDASQRAVDRSAADVLALVNSPAYRDASPHQIVPQLAIRACTSRRNRRCIACCGRRTTHASRPRAGVRRRDVRRASCDGTHQVWSWDITYLQTRARRVLVSVRDDGHLESPHHGLGRAPPRKATRTRPAVHDGVSGRGHHHWPRAACG